MLFLLEISAGSNALDRYIGALVRVSRAIFAGLSPLGLNSGAGFTGFKAVILRSPMQ
jgi:hypothetical protein